MKFCGRMPQRLQYLKKTSNNMSSTISNQFGFIIVRCIKNELTSKYWLKSYHSIRKLYPNTPIVIIDDNSDPQYVNKQLESSLINCSIIQSEKPCCGELLGYYYFLRFHWFKKAIILHDSVFITKHFNFNIRSKVCFLWHIETKEFDDVEWETAMLKRIGTSYLNLYEKKTHWKGCFGVMSIIEYDFLKKISTPLFLLLDEVKTRRHRSCMERIFAVLCFYYYPELLNSISIMGNIHKYPLGWGYHYNTFEHDSKQKKIRFPRFVKVWTGR